MYELNENYFEKIDTENKAYWLGFLLADGYIRKANESLELALKKEDKSHLEKFIEDISYNGPIRDYKNGVAYRVIVNRKSFCRHLINKGVCNNKSLITEPIYFDDEELQRHFWRGYFDGDGTIFKLYPKNEKYKFCLGVYGTKNICEAFGRFVREHCGTIANSIEKRNNHYAWRMSGTIYVKEFHEFLYKNSKIALDRKKVYIVDER